MGSPLEYLYLFVAFKIFVYFILWSRNLLQVVEDGYEFFADRQLVTVFSAPNYCGEFDNAGAMMSVDDTLMCSFQILKPAEKKPKFNSGVSLFGSTTTAKPGNTPAGVKVICSVTLNVFHLLLYTSLMTRLEYLWKLD